MSNMILHATPRDSWSAAQAEGAYRTDSLAGEGFIHCSTAAQIVRVANTLFKGRQDLVLLVIDPQYLQAELKWEPPVHPSGVAAPPTDDLFPHLYGPLNLEAVVGVLPFEAGPNGEFDLPVELQ
jgi:uncharacterized protein (DUF952 family)